MDAIKDKGGLSRQDPAISRFCTPGTVCPDTRVIVPTLRQQILKGANMVFTGVIPTNVPLRNSAVYRTAVSLGANVTDSIVSGKAAASGGEESTYTTHVVAARLGTEKAYRATRIRDVKLVGVDWLWCCAQRWEWVDERLFPVSSNTQGRGVDTPEISSRGTPVMREKIRSKVLRKNDSSMDDVKFVQTNGPPTPEEILESVIPIAFNKDEFDDMDKEVEEYMQADGDDDGEQEDVLGSVSGSSGRSSASSNSSSSSTSSKNCNRNSPLENIRKRKKQLNDQLDLIIKKKQALMDEHILDDNDNGEDGSRTTSSSSSDNSISSDSDLQIVAMLEKQIGE